MKFQRVFCAVMALAMASANVAIAQGKGDHGNRGEKGAKKGGDKRGERADARRGGPAMWTNNRQDVPRDYRHWNRGERLPPQYRDRQYVVDDWRGHHLRQPPRGYHWVQSGGDYLLVAIATGIIADLLLNSR